MFNCETTSITNEIIIPEIKTTVSFSTEFGHTKYAVSARYKENQEYGQGEMHQYLIRGRMSRVHSQFKFDYSSLLFADDQRRTLHIISTKDRVSTIQTLAYDLDKPRNGSVAKIIVFNTSPVKGVSVFNMDAENDNWYANDILRNKMKRQVYLRNGVWCFVDTNEAVIGQVITEEEIRKDLDTYKSKHKKFYIQNMNAILISVSLMSIFSKVGPILLFYGTVQIALNLINEDSSLKPK